MRAKKIVHGQIILRIMTHLSVFITLLLLAALDENGIKNAA